MKQLGVIFIFLGFSLPAVASGHELSHQMVSHLIFISTTMVGVGIFANIFTQWMQKNWLAVVVFLYCITTFYFMTVSGAQSYIKVILLLMGSILVQSYLWRPKPKSMVAWALGIAGILALAITALHIISPQSITPEKYTQECYVFAFLTVFASILLAFARQIGLYLIRINHIVKLVCYWATVVIAGSIGFYVFTHWLDHPAKLSQDGLEVMIVAFWLGFVSICAMIDAYSLGRRRKQLSANDSEDIDVLDLP